jgi:hypothetical protein
MSRWHACDNGDCANASDKKYITDLEYRQTGTPNANLFLWPCLSAACV